jgi:NitT/TauT family transport system substrate-binding protein
MPLSRRRFLCASSTAVAGLGAPRVLWAAPPPVVFGYTGVTDFASVFVAVNEGFFRQRKIEVEPRLIPLNPTIPAALQSGALHIGGPTASVLVQAVNGGLDLVVVSGGAVTSKEIAHAGLVARAGSGIHTAADCVGKKIGVPGLDAFLHITFRAWLKQQGVDHRRIQFVEAPFPLHVDLLRGGSVDALLTGEPYMSRMVDANIGQVASYYLTFLPDNRPTVLYAAHRDWVRQNPETVRHFREAVREGARFVRQAQNDARVRAALARFLKLPPEVLNNIPIVRPNAEIDREQLAYWVDLMREQNMLKTVPDVDRLIVK